MPNISRSSPVAAALGLVVVSFSACGDGKASRKGGETSAADVAADAGAEVMAGDTAPSDAADVAAVDFPPIPTVPGEHPLSFLHDGVARVFIVYVPVGYTPGGAPAPMLVALHGGGGSAEQIFREHGLAEQADKTGWIFVAAQGSPKEGGGGNEWNGSAAFDTGGADDVGYLEAVVLGVSDALGVDPKRRYMAGFSGGATMTVRFGTERSELLAAIATFAGKVGRSADDTPAFVYPPAPATPLSVQMTYGDEDENYVGELQGGVLSTSAMQGMQWWVDVLGCDEPAANRADGRLTFDTWSGCDGAGVVRLVTIAGMGHAWPDKDDEGVEGTKLLVDFFDGKSKP